MIWHSSKWYSCSLIQYILNLRDRYNLEKRLQENRGNMSAVFQGEHQSDNHNLSLKRNLLIKPHTTSCRDRQIELCNQTKHSDLKPKHS